MRRARGERGQILAIVVLALVALLGIAAFAIDVGYAYYAKRQLQSATDAAALAGAQDLPDAATAISDRDGLRRCEHAREPLRPHVHLPDEVHAHLGDRDRLQRGRQSQRARRLGHGRHGHLVRQDLRHRPLQRLGACERVQPVLVVARRHRGRDRPHGIDVHAEGRGRQLHRPRQRQGRRAHDARHAQPARGPDRDGGVPTRADVGDEPLLRALQLTRRQRLRRLRQRQPRLRDRHDHGQLQDSRDGSLDPASGLFLHTVDGGRTPASRPAATPPTARRCGRPRPSCSPTDGRTCPTTSSS